MNVHPTHTPTTRNDFVALQKLMDNVKRGGPKATISTPEEVEAEEARWFEQHARENGL